MHRLVLVATAVLFLTASVDARLGAVDPTFGTGGITSLPLGVYVAHCWDLQLQSDGRILLAGGSEHDTGRSETEYQATLVRLLPDGRPDTSFGQDGVVRGGPRLGIEDTFHVVRVAPDGHVVAGGYDGAYALVARFDETGTPDDAFGTGGRARILIGNATAVEAIALEPGGAMLLALTVWQPGGNDVAVARMLPGGALDPEFGDGGVRRIDRSRYDLAIGLVRQADGRAVVGMAVYDDPTAEYDLTAMRIAVDGSVDPTFDAPVVDLGFTDYNGRLTALADDALLLSSSALAFARLSSDGALDPRFGRLGIAGPAIDPGWTSWGVAADARGRFYAVADRLEDDALASRVFRVGASGRLDRGFGRGAASLPAAASEIALLPDGGAVVAGFGGNRWWVSRLQGPRRSRRPRGG